MEKGDRVKLVFGGGHIGVITAVEKYQVSYPIEGKPSSGWFTDEELELTKEMPGPSTFIGFKKKSDERD